MPAVSGSSNFKCLASVCKVIWKKIIKTYNTCRDEELKKRLKTTENEFKKTTVHHSTCLK